jgi:hypothetical protein
MVHLMNSFNNHFCNFVLLRVFQRGSYLFLIRVKREDFVQGTEIENQTSCSQYEIKVFFSYIAHSAVTTFLEVNKKC